MWEPALLPADIVPALDAVDQEFAQAHAEFKARGGFATPGVTETWERGYRQGVWCGHKRERRSCVECKSMSTAKNPYGL